MSDRERFQAMMLEHLYGVLDPDGTRQLEAYLSTPAGAGLSAEAEAMRAKLAAASRLSFANVRFESPKTQPILPAPASRATTPRSVWIQWIVAASLLFVLGGLGIPAAYQFVGWSAQSRETDTLRTALNSSRADLQKLESETHARQSQFKSEYGRAVAANNAAETAYRDALAAATDHIDLQVRLTGPDRAVPGAPNEWQVETINKQGTATFPKKLELVVKDQKDTELVHETYDHPAASPTLKLPTSFWRNVKPGTDLFLEVVAYTDDNRKNVLVERVPLARPVYVTHLVTDRPMYRPGEVVRFRSLTLDRATLLPPDHDLNLEFRLRNADGTVIPLDAGNGRLVHDLQPLNGPDGKPVRGIGTGEYELPANAQGGEYTLEVTEKNGRNANVLDRRQFLVNHYVPDTLEKSLAFGGKSYGPNETVQAHVEVSRTAGGPIRSPQALTVTAILNGKTIFAERSKQFVVQTDPASGKPRGVLDVQFPLPADLSANREKGRPLNASLAIAIRDGEVTETIIRPIPLIDGGLEVEFFPEGGDLVAGVPSRVYFQVRTPSGKAADLKGTITDGTSVVAEVATLTDRDQPGVNRGLGAFTFTPQAGKKYFLKPQSMTGINGHVRDGFPLPEVKADGVVLTALDRVTEKGKSIRVRVQAAQGPKVLHVGAYARGRLIGHQRVELAAGMPVEVALNGDDAAGGVTRVTVFEEITGNGQRANLVPRAERLVFRQPGQYLRLDVAPDKDKYGPAAQVALDIAARNEAGQPAPAILMVGVVNQSVIAMADSKTDRLLPTHFLVAGDVRDSSDLEYADFLLTDHPKAGETLDLLLGTQGWRRFAEQDAAPADPRDAQAVERMMVARGGRGDASIELSRLETQHIAAEFRPKLEPAAMRLVNAEDALDRFQKSEEPAMAAQVAFAQARVDGDERRYEESAADLYKFETRSERIRGWAMPLFLLGLLGLAVGGAAVAAARYGRERRRYVVGAVAAATLCVLVLVGMVMNRGTEEANWAYIKVEHSHGPAIGPAVQDGPNPGNLLDPQDVPNTVPVKSKEQGPGKLTAPIIRNLKDAEERSRLERMASETSGLPKPPSESDAGATELEKERKVLDRVVEVMTRGKPAVEGPAAESSPFIVREYAHVRRPDADAIGGDHAETIYWQPVLVLPTEGRTRVKFQLSDDVGRFRVLIAGHTTDGRLGATVQMIESQK
jgi:alpha-2-macroglobulin-like protein